MSAREESVLFGGKEELPWCLGVRGEGVPGIFFQQGLSFLPLFLLSGSKSIHFSSKGDSLLPQVFAQSEFYVLAYAPDVSAVVWLENSGAGKRSFWWVQSRTN